MQIIAVPYDHPDATTLIEEQQRDEAERYGQVDQTPVDPTEFAAPHGVFLVAYRDGVAVACGGWRRRGADAELKRMFVMPSARGNGFARAILAELERTAAAAGLGRLILETGLRQPEAIALYRSAGYAEVPAFGFYADDPDSVYLGKELTSAVR